MKKHSQPQERKTIQEGGSNLTVTRPAGKPFPWTWHYSKGSKVRGQVTHKGTVPDRLRGEAPILRVVLAHGSTVMLFCNPADLVEIAQQVGPYDELEIECLGRLDDRWRFRLIHHKRAPE